jgi:predicted alpha/beta superfamily hydrolase
VKSEIVKENYGVIVYKPNIIIKSDSVKFLYLLDGENSNDLYQELSNKLKESITDMIVIGIINNDRRRDMLYVNGAGNFLSFITTELIPIIEKDYKAKTRILHGHSFGGSFTIYSMINKPELFDCFIATSPTPIMDLVSKESYHRIDSLRNSKLLFYFSYGSKDIKQVQKWSKKLKENLTGMKFGNLDWRFKIFEGKSHADSEIDALVDGLKEFNK